jgi:ABC-2 type transport system permease protein
MTANASLRSSLASESAVFAGRQLTRWRREPLVPIQALLFPTLLLVTYYLLVGKSFMRITGTDSLYHLVPMCAIAGAMAGALGSGVALVAERDWGLLSQFWTLPVNRASALTGRLLAEAARTLAGTTLITAVGVGLGLRFKGGWLAVIPYILVPILVVVVFSTAVIAIAVRSKNPTMLTWLGMASIGSVFGCAGVPPVEMLPSWTHSLIRLHPLSPTIESMRALAEGSPALWPLLLTCAWILGAAAAVGPLAVRGYRTAAENFFGGPA